MDNFENYSVYSDSVAPVAQRVSPKAIAALIPSAYSEHLGDCEIFAHDGWLHIRSKSLNALVLSRGWEHYAPVLRELGCKKLLFVGIGVPTPQDPYCELVTLELIEEIGTACIARQEAEAMLKVLKNYLPEEVKAALWSVSICNCCGSYDTLFIVFADPANWPEGCESFRSLENVLAALPWLADADQYGFNKVELVELLAPRETKLYRTFTISQIKDQRRAALTRSLGV